MRVGRTRLQEIHVEVLPVFVKHEGAAVAAHVRLLGFRCVSTCAHVCERRKSTLHRPTYHEMKSFLKPAVPHSATMGRHSPLVFPRMFFFPPCPNELRLCLQQLITSVCHCSNAIHSQIHSISNKGLLKF